MIVVIVLTDTTMRVALALGILNVGLGFLFVAHAISANSKTASVVPVTKSVTIAKNRIVALGESGRNGVKHLSSGTIIMPRAP